MKKIKLMDLITLTKPPIHLMIIGLILAIFSAVAGLMMPLMAKYVVENIAYGISIQVILIIGATLCCWIISMIFSVYLLQYAGLDVVKTIRTKLWDKLLALPVSYYDKEHSGQLISRVTNDTMVLKELVSFKLAEFVTNSITIIGAIIILFIIDVPMTLALLACVPFIVLIIVPFGDRLFQIAMDEEEEMAELSGNLSQTLSEIRLIKAYGTEKKEFEKGETNFNNLFKYGIKTAKLQSLLEPLVMISSMLIFIFVIAFGAYRVNTLAMSSGDLVAFLLYLFQIVFPIASMGDFFTSLQKTKGAISHLFVLLKSEEEDIHTGIELDEVKEIHFNELEFSYDNKKVLDKISFSVTQGETVAIVGPSGVGKSTIFGVIEQFLELDSGSIHVNGNDLKTYSIKSWRKNISYVQQESPLLMGTIKENITYGIKEEVSQFELENAAKLAGAYDFIVEQPEGFDALIGERGRNLSGGQKQRIAVARAILRNPSVLLFDEATASLDTESEKIIQHSINNVKDGKIVFVIAHRLSTIVDSNKIIVLEDGKISGMGTHKELLKSHASYRKLVEQQFVDNQSK